MLFWMLMLVCLCGCSDDSFQGTLLKVSASPATGVPIEIQELLWDDPEEEKEKLRLILQNPDEHPDWLPDTYRLRICKAEQQRLYYTKYIDAEGIAILGNSDVTDAEFHIARDTVLRMTVKHPELRQLLSATSGYRVILVPLDELVLDVPEFNCDGEPRDPSRDISRGGYFFSVNRIGYDRLAASVGMKADHYDTLVHEFAHSIHHRLRTSDSRLKHLGDPTFEDRLKKAYEKSIDFGTWKGLYAETNHSEYWAEGVRMWYYDIGTGRAFPTHEDFAARDPLLAELIDEWFAKDSFWERN